MHTFYLFRQYQDCHNYDNRYFNLYSVKQSEEQNEISAQLDTIFAANFMSGIGSQTKTFQNFNPAHAAR